MFNKRTVTVIKRELQAKLFSKGFILMTILVPVFLIGILGLQAIFVNIEGDENTVLQIVSEDKGLVDKLENAFAGSDVISKGKYSISFKTINNSDLEGYVNNNKQELLNNKLTGIVYIPNKALNDKQIQYYSKNPGNNAVFNKIRNTINTVLVEEYFLEKNLSEEEIEYAQMWVDFKGFRVSEGEDIKEKSYGNEILAFLFTFLLYMSLIFLGTMVMRSVVEEKNNRIVEVLLSSVNAKELMTGKILGNAITGAAQMVIWLIPVMLLISTTWFVLPKEFTIGINMFHVLYFMINYFLGLLTFLGLFTMVGALFDNDQDAQSGTWPVLLLIMIPFFMSFSLRNNPDNTLGLISSMAPFSSIIVMPARMTLTDIPLWQFLVTIVVNIFTIYLIFNLAGKI